MKNLKSVSPKTRIVFLLVLLFGLILVKNWRDRHKISELTAYFSSVYEDRLLVENYIFQLSDHLYQKKMLLDQCAQQSSARLPALIKEHNEAMDRLIGQYEKTRFTETETIYFEAFKKDLARIQGLEKDWAAKGSTPAEHEPLYDIWSKEYLRATGHLYQLSRIQVREGKHLTDSSTQILSGFAMLDQLELVLLVALAGVIYWLFRVSYPLLPRFPQKPDWN